MKQGLKLSPLVSSYVKAPRPIKYNTNLNMAQKLTNDEFWEAQKRMAGNLSDAVNEEEKKERA
jgi:hypothetical protein